MGLLLTVFFIISMTAIPCASGDIRMVGFARGNDGRVDICIDGRWGSICDEGWSTVDAQVACTQLGFSSEGSCYHLHSKSFNSKTLLCNNDTKLYQ